MFKPFAVVLGLALVVLIGVLFVRAWRLASLQPEVEEASDVFLDEDAAVERLAAAVRQPTVSHQDEARMDSSAFRGLHTLLGAAFPDAHRTLTRETISDLSLLYTWPGRDTTLAPIMLTGHLDVVPADSAAWQQPPFEGAVADGYLWGRGTLDDKVGVLGIMEAVEALVRDGFRPERTVYLAFAHDEEVHSERGAARIASLLAERGVRLDFVLDEGGFITHDIVPGMTQPVAIVGIAEKGYVTLELHAEGAGGHSSTPPLRSPIGVLGEAVAALEQHQMPARLDGVTDRFFAYLAPEMPLLHRVAFANLWLFRPVVLRMLERSPSTNAVVRTTTAPTLIRGGVQENVLPSEATALVNFRILPGETVEDVLAHARSVIDDPRVRVAIREDTAVRNPSAIASTEAAGFERLQATIRQVAGREVVVAPYLVTGGTDGRHYEAVADNVYRFLPVAIGPDDVPRIHGADERIAPDNYAMAIHFYYQFVLNTAGRE